MAGQFNIPGLDLTTMMNQQPTVTRGSKTFIQKGPSIQAGPLQNIFGPEAPRVEFYSNYKPNLSERAEEANKAIEAWQKKQFGNIAKTAGKSGEAIKAGVNYMKPIAKLGGKVAGVASIPLSIYEGVTAEDPFGRGAAIATGIGGAGMMFGGSPYITVPSAVLAAGGMAAPYIRDWVENNNRQQEANKVLERQLLEEEIRRRGLDNGNGF